VQRGVQARLKSHWYYGRVNVADLPFTFQIWFLAYLVLVVVFVVVDWQLE
jgi:hypothetical protein